MSGRNTAALALCNKRQHNAQVSQPSSSSIRKVEYFKGFMFSSHLPPLAETLLADVWLTAAAPHPMDMDISALNASSGVGQWADGA